MEFKFKNEKLRPGDASVGKILTCVSMETSFTSSVSMEINRPSSLGLEPQVWRGRDRSQEVSGQPVSSKVSETLSKYFKQFKKRVERPLLPSDQAVLIPNSKQ